jgi:membrane associated rhomboid family serine protease
MAKKTVEESNTLLTIFILIIILIWIIGTILSFVTSLICLFYESTIQDKIIGVIFGLIAGPFYWIYYVYNMKYCNNKIMQYNNYNNILY